jgi:allantoicase
MSDGWETKRRRGPGHDWAIIKLGIAGEIRRVEVDTTHFKGNFPESCSLETLQGDYSSEELSELSLPWATLLPRIKLQSHTRHYFEDELLDTAIVTHLRFNIFPDGGVSRLRVYGISA